MKKRFLLMALVLLSAFVLVACNEPTPTVEPTPTPTPTVPVLSTITFSGANDVTIAFEAEFNVLTGVTATGNDGLSYTNIITYVSTSDISATHMLDTTKTGVHAIRYEAKVGTVTAQRWRYVTVEAPERPEGLVVNSDFAEGTAFWDDAANGLYLGDGGLTITHEDGALKAEVTAGPQMYMPRFGQQMIAFEQGKTYEVSFKAKSSVNKTINLQVGELLSNDPWFVDFKPGQSVTREITTEWATYTYKFTMTLDNPRGGILFELGKVGTQVDATMWFDDITAVESTADPIVYEGYDFLTGWTEGDPDTYDFTTVDETTVVDYTKGGTYAFMRRDFAAVDAEGYNTLVMTLQGTAGKTVLIKPNDLGSLEQTVTFGAEPVTVLISASAFTTVIVFAEPGTADVSGQFTILEAVLTYIEGATDPVWKGYNFTVDETDTQVSLTYPATPVEWWNNNAQLAIVDFDGIREELLFTFTGVVGHEYVFKIEGGGKAKESSVVATGVEQEFILDLSEFTEAERDAFNLLIVFVKTEAAAGTVVLKNWEYVYSWIGYGLTAVQTETDVTITYASTPNNWWENNAQLTLKSFDGTKVGVSFTFTGVATQEYVFKIEGSGQAKEVTVLATGAEQTVEINLSELTKEQRDGLNLLIIFSKTPAASGTLVVKNWEYLYKWVGYGLTVAQTETDVTITYANTPNNWWENNAQLPLKEFDGTKTSISFTFTGVAGQKYLFKIEGGGQNKETFVESATGLEETVVADLSAFTEAQRDAFTLIIIFSCTPGASGTIVVDNWVYVTP